MGWLLVGIPAAPAVEPDVANVVKGLLSRGWAKTDEAKALANHATLENPPRSTDASVLAARWLVFMHQSSHDDALKMLDRSLKAMPAPEINLAALQATAWIHTVNQHYGQAVAVADQLTQAACPNPPATDTALLEAQNDAIAFVGCLAGFLEGPCEKTADQKLRKTLEEKVLQRLDEPRKKVFAEAKAAVLAKFKERLDAAGQSKKSSADAAAAEKKQSLAKIAEDTAALKKEISKLEDDKKPVGSDQKEQLAALDKEALPFIREETSLQAKLNAIMPQLTQQQDNVQQLQQQIANAMNGQARQQLQNQLSQAQTAANNTQQQVNSLNGQIAPLQVKLKTINQKEKAIDREASGKIARLDDQIRDKNQQLNKQDRLKTLAKNAKAPGNPQAAALGNAAHAFRTYHEFPLEAIRATLLKSIDGDKHVAREREQVPTGQTP